MLGIEKNSDDNIHQFIISEEKTLTVYNDGVTRKGNYSNICIAFTVNDVDVEFERLESLGVEITDHPTERPWGIKNMMFKVPDENNVVFRSFRK